MEDQNQTNEETGKMKQWMQDNLRIIISILIVVAIAGGIYSYSKRTQAPSIDQIAQESAEETSEAAKIEGTTDTAAPETAKKKPVAQAGTSQETEQSFVETAGAGDSSTKLARKALANYLEKNPDSALTAEHKIYIEDFLRKNTPKKRIFVGTSVEFSKELIQNAIAKAKNLNERQVQNLHKYAVRVSSLS